MTGFDEYQAEAGKTDHFDEYGPDSMTMLLLALGLCGEAGEVAEKIKKYIRDGGEHFELAYAIKLELGDVLWYLARLAKYFDIPLSTVAEANTVKLRSRVERNKLHGSGDYR